MSLEVVPLGEEHLENAAALASSRYNGLREQINSVQLFHEAAPAAAALARAT